MEQAKELERAINKFINENTKAGHITKMICGTVSVKVDKVDVVYMASVYESSYLIHFEVNNQYIGTVGTNEPKAFFDPIDYRITII